MNKMTKGALAIGIGSAMLLGGGGTLAVWNQTQNASAGTIAAGELGLTAGKGVWSSNGTAIDDINTYKIVPGETLTYSQPLTVKLEGDKMQAKLTVDSSKVLTGDFAGSDLMMVQAPTLTDSASKQVLPGTILTPLPKGQVKREQLVTASASFKFDAAALSSVGAKADLSSVQYKLDQLAVPAAPVQ
ncbi:alternate-type signal peptide domain-containing protein [Arthrobacter yangruifuii]|uniref:alternate-type signal peptide domain-containing protein n=1 Tax=Arthrobacter yangruifuii TaxID=2606616 RepID=UPI0016440D72|nr:alternate-type signal peptide domain-containing protein [Arthrobacter yangruifuii]